MHFPHNRLVLHFFLNYLNGFSFLIPSVFCICFLMFPWNIVHLSYLTPDTRLILYGGPLFPSLSWIFCLMFCPVLAFLWIHSLLCLSILLLCKIIILICLLLKFSFLLSCFINTVLSAMTFPVLSALSAMAKSRLVRKKIDWVMGM